ncbi:ROK family protein [Paenibacillus sp. Z3-2]
MQPESGRINRIVDPLAGLEQAFSLESLSGAFPCEVILENDVNLAALGEYRSGAADYPLFIFFSIGTGTGAGIMVHGQLLRGLGGLTGEIAEMLMEDGRCLEEVLSADGLMQLAKRLSTDKGASASSMNASYREVKKTTYRAVQNLP